MIITSNDPETPVFSSYLKGMRFSSSADGDGDGMPDWGEYSMRGLGFDWSVSLTSLVSDYYAQANTIELYTQAEAAGVIGDGSLFNTDPINNTIDLVIEPEESLDLETHIPMTLDPSNLSVDIDGNIRYQLDATPDRTFFHAVWKDRNACENSGSAAPI